MSDITYIQHPINDLSMIDITILLLFNGIVGIQI